MRGDNGGGKGEEAVEGFFFAGKRRRCAAFVRVDPPAQRSADMSRVDALDAEKPHFTRKTQTADSSYHAPHEASGSSPSQLWPGGVPIASFVRCSPSARMPVYSLLCNSPSSPRLLFPRPRHTSTSANVRTHSPPRPDNVPLISPRYRLPQRSTSPNWQ